MSTAAADVSGTHEPIHDKIECPCCLGRGNFSRREVLQSLGIKDDGLTDQVWSLEELVGLLESRRRRERQREIIANMDNCD
jgi:hypothetical protein